ncbi:cytochrome b561 [Patiriisocius marinistellae]|uniref:Cytochrome b561 n=1 Tax=Patiriisocius marinistellae TaxID=2494560 RepID=A0A5J4G1C2_9FLAO|nr:COX15/CtaA family protein [Patiriisocius marinistellae]GEQ85831.1 cytochrome b561 [Patiriisocius marinistellae]
MYRESVKIALILVYLVIIAGAMVRMTGSGMGCPDWPKCFGYYIPPTEASVLEWAPERTFEKGHVIIVGESLKVATVNFTTSTTYDERNWETYTKHDYATFNVWHTWIEYINRLFGALSGLAILAMAILSIWKWKHRKRITILSIVSVFMIVFQAWLGATVVYSVLSPVKITIHMVMALVIVAVLIYLLYISAENRTEIKVFNNYKKLLLVALLLTLVQVILGTQVRQHVDETVDIVGYEAKSLWLENPTLQFYIHRTFSVIVLVLNLSLFYTNRKLNYGLKKMNWVLILIGLEVATGMAMYYFDFPALSQPAHLIVASLLFGVQFYVAMEAGSFDLKRKAVTLQK